MLYSSKLSTTKQDTARNIRIIGAMSQKSGLIRGFISILFYRGSSTTHSIYPPYPMPSHLLYSVCKCFTLQCR